MDNIAKLNQEVRSWSRDVAGILRQNVMQITNSGKAALLKKRYSPQLATNIKPRIKTTSGMTERIAFSYPRHGYFISVGSSRGHKKNVNPRKIQDWYSQTIDEQVEVLSDIVVRNIEGFEVKTQL